MGKNWFYRLLLSYLPGLILIVCLFMFIGMIQLSELSQQNAVKSSRVYAQNVQNNVDMSLRSIELMMIETISRNTKLTFFAGMESSPEFIVDLSQLLQSMLNTNSLIDSIYVYRAADGTVVTDMTKLTLDQFADRAFIEAGMAGQPAGWSAPRLFRTVPDSDDKRSVISIVKTVPLIGKGTALLVVNVGVEKVRDYLNQFGQSDVSYIAVTDRSGGELFGQGSRNTGSGEIEVVSAYTGWSYKSGLKAMLSGNVVSYMTSGWLLLGLLGLLTGIAWFVYISRKNYKPIESMVTRIRTYNQRRNTPFVLEPAVDELSYIDYTLNNMIMATEDYEHRSREDRRFRRLRLFQELVEGGGPVDEAAWNEELRALGLDAFAGASVIVIEIDKYSEFIRQYTHGDQGLFKYILTKVVEETAKAESLPVWQEWVTNHRLYVLYFDAGEPSPSASPQSGSRLLARSEQVRQWLHDNIKLTATIGVGKAVAEAADIAGACEAALQALSYKSSLGSNRVIGHWEVEELPHDDLFVYLQHVRTIAQAFRLGNEGWLEQLGLLFDGLRTLLLPREEIDGVLTYMNYFFQREMMELPPDYQELWNRGFRAQWESRSEGLETLDELEAFYAEELTRCFQEMGRLRADKGNQSVIREVRAYIGRHFDNPDLSLTLLGEQFHMNTSSLSTLFKEEFGEKFVAYLCRVRMEHAKELLSGGDLPVHEIAGKVGYQHTMSFIRTFKKTVGVTPGDYRKAHQ